MVRCLLLFFVIQYCSLHAIIAISIGENCSTALALREYGTRAVAYPFDWIIAPFSGVYTAFAEDFIHFFDEQHFRLRSDNHGIINYYGFQFVHDFPTIQKDRVMLHDDVDGKTPYEEVLQPNWKESIPEIAEKYERRIKRFRDVLQGTEKVYLIRYHGITKDQAIKLRDLIKQKYPALDFTLVAVGSTADMHTPWNLPKILNFYFNERGPANDPAQWKQIFGNLGLIPIIQPTERKVQGQWIYSYKGRKHRLYN